MKRSQVNGLAKVFLFPLFICPRPIKKLAAWGLASFWYYVLRIRVKETKKRVSAVFPKKTDNEVSEIVRGSFYNLMLIFIEYSYFPFSKKRIIKHTEIKDAHLLDEALATDRPVFLYTGHLANGEIILSRLCYEGYKMNLIAKKVGNKFLDKTLIEIREVSGLNHIPPKNAIKDIARAIKRRDPIAFLQDQYMRPPKGLKTTFLGLETYTNPSIARLAHKYKAIVIPVLIYREKEKTVAQICEEIPYEYKYESNEENYIHMTQVYNDWLTAQVKKRPSEWMWVHRRWKNLKL